MLPPDRTLNSTDTDDMVKDVDPTLHEPGRAHRYHLHSIDQSNLLLAIYATLRRIEDRLTRENT